MVNRSKLLSLALLGFGLATYSFSSDQTKEFKAFLDAEAPKVKAAFEGKDLSYFDKTATPDFHMTEMGRKTNKKQSMAAMKQWFDMASNIKADFKLNKCLAKNNKGTAETVGDYSMDIMAPDKKSHKMTMHEVATETWKKTKSGWMISSIVAKSASATMDGKPVNPMTMQPLQPKKKIG